MHDIIGESTDKTYEKKKKKTPQPNNIVPQRRRTRIDKYYAQAYYIRGYIY